MSVRGLKAVSRVSREREAEGEDTYDEHKLGLTVQRKPCCVYFRCRRMKVVKAVLRINRNSNNYE